MVFRCNNSLHFCQYHIPNHTTKSQHCFLKYCNYVKIIIVHVHTFCFGLAGVLNSLRWNTCACEMIRYIEITKDIEELKNFEKFNPQTLGDSI